MLLGEACAVGAALCWSVSLILFKHSEKVSAQAMNLFKNVVAVGLLAVTMAVMGLRVDWTRPASEWLALVISGVLGIAVADTLTFLALRRVGPGLLAVIDCAYAPTMVAFSVMALGERVTTSFLLGGALVCLGVLAAVLETPGGGLSRRDVVVGTSLGVAGILVMGFGVLLSKPIVEKSALVEVSFIRLVAGAAAQLLWIACVPAHRGALAVLKPNPAWKTLLPAAVLSAYLSMLLWLGGFKWTSASRASVLNQLTTVFTIVLAWVFLGETLSRRRAVGALAAGCGALVVVLART